MGLGMNVTAQNAQQQNGAREIRQVRLAATWADSGDADVAAAFLEELRAP